MTEPLRITSKQAGTTVTRILLSSGSYVVAHMDGRYTCIHSQCVGQGKRALDCEHVRFVQANDTPDEGEEAS